MVEVPTHPIQPVPTEASERRGGLQCLAHILAGWPANEDCPCVTDDDEETGRG